jgi:hypothetical protein
MTEFNAGSVKITGVSTGTNPNDAVNFSQLSAAVTGAVTYVSGWNASTNTPSLASGVGTKGHMYTVTVPGATNIDGVTDWKSGDALIFNGTIWEKTDNSEAVVSVNGQDGVVVLDTDDVAEGSTNLYFTTNRAQNAAVQNSLSASTVIAPSATAVVNYVQSKQRRIISTQTAAYTTGGYYVLYLNSSANMDGIATAINNASWETQAVYFCQASSSNTVDLILNTEEIVDTSWAWTPGGEIFATGNGNYTQTAPSGSGESVISVGHAINATTILPNVKFVTRYT